MQPTSSPRRPPASSACLGVQRERAGLTLLELVLVMFLLALVVGSGLGAFSALDLGRRQAAGLVRSVVRSAQNTAIASHAPARVVIDRAGGTLQAESLMTIGTWHFEDRAVTGQGPQGIAEPEWFDDRGFVGAAFHPKGRRGATVEIPVQGDPAFDFRRGFSIECALLRETEAGGRVLSIGGRDPFTIALDLGPTGNLRASFRSRVGDALSERPGGQVICTSEGGLVPIGRWVIVRVLYDRRRLEIWLDGTVVAAQDTDAFVWETDGPLTLSDDRYPFPGKIDGLVVGTMVAGDPVALPESVTFAGDSAERVQFVSGGGLDTSVHRDPARIGLDFRDGSRLTVVVGFYGTVE